MAAAALLALIPNILHGTVGFQQFGYRFSIDAQPFLVALAVAGAARSGNTWRSRPSWLVRRGRDAVDRDQRLRDGRDHAVRVLAVTRSIAGGEPPATPLQADRRAHLAIAGLITLGVALRLLTLRSPGFPSDVGTFQAWAEQLARVGAGRLLRARLFRRLPTGIPLRPVALRRGLRRRAASSRGEGREHPGRYRDRDRCGDDRVASRWSWERDVGRGSVVAQSRRDLRRSVLGTDRRRRLAAALRGAGRGGARPLRDRRSARGTCRDGEASVRHRGRPHHRRCADRAGPVRAVAAAGPRRSRRRGDRARARGAIQGRRSGAHRPREEGSRDLSVHVAVRVQRLVDRRRLLAARRSLRRVRPRAARRGPPSGVLAAVVASRHRDIPRGGRDRGLRLLLPPDPGARAVSLPRVRAAAPARRHARAPPLAVRRAGAHLRALALLRIHALRPERSEVAGVARDHALLPERPDPHRARHARDRRSHRLAAHARRSSPAKLVRRRSLKRRRSPRRRAPRGNCPRLSQEAAHRRGGTSPSRCSSR